MTVSIFESFYYFCYLFSKGTTSDFRDRIRTCIISAHDSSVSDVKDLTNADLHSMSTSVLESTQVDNLYASFTDDSVSSTG